MGGLADDDSSRCLRDIGLDQIFGPLLRREHEFDLADLYRTPVDEKTIIFRQEILGDLEHDRTLAENLRTQARTLWRLRDDSVTGTRENSATVPADGADAGMTTVADDDADSEADPGAAADRFLLRRADRAAKCLAAINELVRLLDRPVKSRGLRRLRLALAWYTRSDDFTRLDRQVRAIRRTASSFHALLLLEDDGLRLRTLGHDAPAAAGATGAKSVLAGPVDSSRTSTIPSDCVPTGFEDAGALAQQTFGALAAQSRLANPCIPSHPFLDTIDDGIAGLAVKAGSLHFDGHDLLVASDVIAPDVFCLARQIEFYCSWIDVERQLKESTGLALTVPHCVEKQEEVRVRGGFDLALALRGGTTIVPNDYTAQPGKAVTVINGPNQGGKTTFLRMIGQIAYLTSLGLSVPAREADMFCCDRVLTHFSDPHALPQEGQLANELIRLKEILGVVTPSSLVLVNEIFSTTTLDDAQELGEWMIDRLRGLGCMTFIVTFIDDLSRLPGVLSLVSRLGADHHRTFRVVPGNADGRADALFLLSCFGLTADQIQHSLSTGEADQELSMSPCGMETIPRSVSSEDTDDRTDYERQGNPGDSINGTMSPITLRTTRKEA